MKILFNADDFGLTKGVTDGIIKSHANGVVKTTTLMMNGLAVDYAVKQANLHSTLKVGIHPMTHPGYVDEQLSQVSSYIDSREKELNILCNLPVPNWATI